MGSSLPRGFRSATEYHSSEEQVDAILRTTAYPRPAATLSVISFTLKEHAGIRSSTATPFQKTSKVGLGSLERPPLAL